MFYKSCFLFSPEDVRQCLWICMPLISSEFCCHQRLPLNQAQRQHSPGKLVLVCVGGCLSEGLESQPLPGLLPPSAVFKITGARREQLRAPGASRLASLVFCARTFST